jgi:NADPH:quinone reductase-like Zn-dependent oxidoreductase
VQIGRWLGAEVTGVCSGRNVEMVRSLGADHVIDYTREDFTRGGRRYDLLLDNAGNHSLADCLRALTARGTLVSNSGESKGRWIGPLSRIARVKVAAPFVSQRLRFFLARVNHADLALLKELVESGRVTPVIDRTVPLSETAEAVGYVMAGHARGKVVISV